MSLSQRVLGAVDLAIEFATLGEYGLEQSSTTCTAVASAVRPDAEALATARRGAAPTRAAAAAMRHAELAGRAVAAQAQNDKEPPEGGSLGQKETAATYSPRDASPKYHRR